MNEASCAAQLLGRRGKGIPHKCTPEDRESRRLRAAKAREKLAEMMAKAKKDERVSIQKEGMEDLGNAKRKTCYASVDGGA